jgi:hypothetical protein
VLVSAFLKNTGGKCMNFRLLVKQRGEMCPFLDCCKRRRRCVNFRIFQKQRGEMLEFSHFCKTQGGDVSTSALL